MSMKHARRFTYVVSLLVHIDAPDDDAAYERIKGFLVESALRTEDIDVEFDIVESEQHSP